jgi:hypothetical protein
MLIGEKRVSVFRGGWGVPSLAASPTAAALAREGNDASALARVYPAQPDCIRVLNSVTHFVTPALPQVGHDGARFAVGPLPKFGQVGFMEGFGIGCMLIMVQTVCKR